MTTPDIHHLAAAYALDALDEHERQAFEAHYPSCDVCRADVLDHRETLAELAAAEPVQPSGDVRTRVLTEIGRTRQLSPLLPDGVTLLAERRRRRRRVASTVLAAAAAVVLVVGGAVFVARDGTGVDPFANDLAAVVEQVDARIVTLDGTGAGTVRVVWSAEAERAVLIGDGLDDPAPGSVYELWLIDDAGPHPMQLLATPVDGSIRSVVGLTGEPAAWGVTIEPERGSPAPTGEILYVAEL